MLVCIVSACSKEESVDMSTEQKNQVSGRTLTKSAPVYQECGDYEFASLFQCTKAIKSDDNFTVTFYAKVHTEEQPENVFVKVYNQQTGEYFYDSIPLEAKIVGNYYIYKYKKVFRTVGTFNYKYLVQPSEKPQLYTIKKFDDIIETGTYYGPDENILQYFQHYCQRYANNNPKGSFYNNSPYDRSDATLTVTNTCCPTCYMMVAACLAHVKYGWQTDYQVSGTKLASIVKNKELAKIVDGYPNYTRMNKFEWYNEKIDGDFLEVKFHQKLVKEIPSWEQRKI